MFWPFTLIHRPKPVPTLDDTRREQLRAAQFALLDLYNDLSDSRRGDLWECAQVIALAP